MDENYVWPLVGVILGWILSLFASGLKDRAENKQRIGRLLSRLFLVYEQVKILNASSEHLKDIAGSWESYERIRKRIIDQNLLNPDSSFDSLDTAINEISGGYPLQAIDLRGLMENLRKHKELSLQHSSKKEDLYIQNLSVHEVGLELCERKLRQHIVRFSFRHDLVTFVRVAYRMHKSKANLSSNEEFIRQFMKYSSSEVQGGA